MKRLHHIIWVLTLSLILGGYAQAGMDYCPPDCSHCGAEVQAVAPCCADGIHGAGETGRADTAHESTDHCGPDEFCPGNQDQKEAVAASVAPSDVLHRSVQDHFNNQIILSSLAVEFVSSVPPPRR